MGKELPKNWALPKLKQIVKYQKGKKPKILNEEEFDGSVPYLDIKAFEKDEVRRYADVKSSTLIEKDEIGIVWDGARSGWVSKNKAGAVGSTIAILKPVGVNPELLYRFLESKFDYLNTNTRGIGIPHVDPNVLWDIDFPLPPLPEQTRIVAKLDQLFGQLEQIKESLNKIPQLLKDFRQQVLTQAVTGKLTEEWREGKIMRPWETKTIGEIAESLSGFAFKSKDFVDEGIQLIRMGNLYDNKLDLGRNPVFLPDTLDKKIIDKYKLRKDDVLLSLTGTKYKRDYGYAIKVETERELLLNQRILALRPKIDVDYFLFILRNDIFRNQFFSFETGGVNQGNVGSRAVLTIKVYVPEINEQQEIVRRIETLFAKTDTIEQQYQTLKQKIDTLPQAILHKAFKGELVPQLESDGDAWELLEEINGLKKQTPKPISKKPKAYKVYDVELGRVAEDGKEYSKK